MRRRWDHGDQRLEMMMMRRKRLQRVPDPVFDHSRRSSRQRKHRFFVGCIVLTVLFYVVANLRWSAAGIGGDPRAEVSVENLTIQKSEPAAKETSGERTSEHSDDTTLSSANNENYKVKSMKHILYYTNYWEGKDFQFGIGQQPFIDYKCPYTNCYATNNRTHLSSSLSNFDALLFHPIDGDPQFDQIRKWRRPHQRFVLMYMESPDYLDWNADGKYNHLFNWTMTYRWDSDFPRPYGWFHSKNDNDEPPLYPLIPQWKPYNVTDFRKRLAKKPAEFLARANKTKQVAWIVSNCHTKSKREDYVTALKRYINVDVMGGCGSLPCQTGFGDTQKQDDCTAAVERDYKFYLAFENSFCDDYVTEKFFTRMKQTVTVVMGQANYTRLAPPHSYINVLDYPSPQALANYLLALDRDPQAYLSYFWWQDYYQVRPEGVSQQARSTNFAQAMCRLCERLHTDNNTTKVYENMQDWWKGKSHCGAKKAPMGNETDGAVQYSVPFGTGGV